MPTILFVCTANRYRSSIAEACFKLELVKRSTDGNWEVLSAGTWTTDGMPAMPVAIQKASELGLDIQAHRSRVITAEILQTADLILAMEQGQKEALQNEFPQEKGKIFLLSDATQGISFDFPDPVKDPTVGNIAAEICGLLKKYFEKIIELAESV